MENLLTGREIDLLLSAIEKHELPDGAKLKDFSAWEIAEVKRKLEIKKRESE
jgi:hypothetical protein